MIDAETYIATVADWIRFWDGKVYDARVGPQPATVGHLYDQFVTNAGSELVTRQMHTCVVMAPLQSVDTDFAVHDFMGHVSAHAYATSRGLPGLGTVEVAIAALVSPLVHASAAAAANGPPPPTRWGMNRPVVVDLTTGDVHANVHGGSSFFAVANANLAPAANLRVRRLFPFPAELRRPPDHAPAD